MPQIKFDIRGDNKELLDKLQQTQQAINATIGQLSQGGQQVDKTFSRLGASIDNITKNALGGLKTMTAAMLGYTAISKVGDYMQEMIANVGQFNKAMTEVSTISKEVTENMADYKKQVAGLTAEIPIGATEAAKALYQIVSAGQEGANAMKVLEVSAKAAVGGVTETATAADTITTLLNAYHLSASEAESISDKLFTTVRLGKTTMTELGASIAQAAPTAAAYGVSMNELLGAVATLTKQGVPTAIAMTQINAAITEAVNVLGDSAFEGRTFAEALGEIRDSADGSMTALKGSITNIRALKGALGLTGDAASTAKSDLEAMANATGAAESAFQKMNNTAGASAERLKSHFQAAIMPIASTTKSVSKFITDSLNRAFDTGAMEDFAVTLAGLVAGIGVYKASVLIATRMSEGHTIASLAEAKAIAIKTKAQLAFNRALALSPAAIVAISTAALAVAVYKLATAETGAEAAATRLNEKLEAQKRHQAELNERNQKAIDMGSDVKASITERRKAIEELASRYPKIISKYVDEEYHLTNILQLNKEIAEYEGNRQTTVNRKEQKDAEKYADVIRKASRSKNGVASLSPAERKLHEEAQERFENDNGFATILASNPQDVAAYFDRIAKGLKKVEDSKATGKAIDKFNTTLKGRDKGDLKRWQNVFIKAQQRFRNGIKAVNVKGFGMLTEEQVALLLNSVTKTDTSKSSTAEKGYSYWEKERDKYETQMKKYASGTKAFTQARKKFLEAEAELKKYSKDDGSASTLQTNKKNADDRQRLADTQTKAKKEALRAKIDAEQATTQYEIDSLRDGSEKRIRQIKFDNEKELEAIRRAKEDAVQAHEDRARAIWEAQNPNAGEQNRTWENSGKVGKRFDLTDEEKKMFSARESLAKETLNKQLEAEAKANNQYMIDYLKQYGSYEQQRLAITEETEKEIARLRASGASEWQVESAKEVGKAQLDKLKSDNVFDSIDWNNVFGDLQNKTKQYLVSLRTQLEDILKDGSLKSIEDIEKIQKKIAEIREEEGRKGGLLSFRGSKSLEAQRLEENAHNAQSNLSQAIGEQTKAWFDLQSVKTKGGTTEQTTIAENKLAKAREKTAKASEKARQAEEASKKASAQALADWFSDAQDFIAEKGIDQLPDLLNNLGLGSVGEKVGKGLSGFNNAAGAAADFASGNYIGAVAKGVSAIKDFGSALGIGGGNADKVNKLTEENNKAIESLTQRINLLKSAIEKNTGAKAVNIGNSSIKAQEEINKRAMETLQAQMGYHSAHRSNSYYASDSKIAQMYRSEVDNAISAGEDMKKSIQGLNDIYDMSPEQIAAIKTYMPQLWEYLTSVGKYDKSEYWESVVQQAGKLETITASIKKNITGMTLDNLRSEFKNTLMDMDSDVEDFADNFTQKMTDALLNIELGKEGGLYDELKKWYDKYYDILKNEALSPDELEDALEGARKDYQVIVQKGINVRDNIAKITGYDSASASQKATANGIKSITADQADQLVGRITAMQIAVEANRTTNSDMAENVTLGVNYLMRINESVSLSNETLDAILLQNVRSNSYLEDIVRYNKAMYEGWNEEIIKIRRTIEERT
nr:MAG TPA: minor tail protein [Caudoviricetes sp.]